MNCAQKTTDEFKKLRELTGRIPDFNPWFFNNDRTVQLVCLKGSADSVGVYSNLQISIAETTFREPGTEIGKHTHPQIEHIHVIGGSITIRIFDGNDYVETTVNRNESICIQPNTVHSARSEGGCRFIAITMPFSKHFPKPKW